MIANALLVLSEIVSNAKRHAGTEFTVRTEVKGSTLRVEVLDSDTRPPALQILDGDSTSGRGLHIVAEIAKRWRWSAAERDTASGKVVWAELPLDATGPPRRALSVDDESGGILSRRLARAHAVRSGGTAYGYTTGSVGPAPAWRFSGWTEPCVRR